MASWFKSGNDNEEEMGFKFNEHLAAVAITC